MGKLDGKIDAVFADMAMPQHPGAALLVIDHDEIVYNKCYGLANLETQRPITTDSSFYLASISKQFTAMAIMMLAEEGRLNYEDRLRAYFPQFPTWGTEISLRHLLHHTSGLPHYIQFFSSREAIPELTRDIAGITNEAVLERAMDLAGPELPVGSRYAYGGTSYVLLAMIVTIWASESLSIRPRMSPSSRQHWYDGVPRWRRAISASTAASTPAHRPVVACGIVSTRSMRSP